MKKNLLLVVILVLSGIVKLHAQACTVSNLVVEIKSTSSSGSGCQVTLDATFIGKFNNGNKYAFIHFWETANYPNPAISYAKAPTADQLSGALATFVIQDPSEAGATIHDVYVPDPTGVSVDFAGLQHDVDTFRLTNVVINLSTCGAPVPVVGDVWASQGDNAQKPQCFTKSAFNIIFNNTIVGGIKQCANPPLINFSIKNAHTTLGESVAVSAYIDVNEDGDVDDGTDIEITSYINSALPSNPIDLAPGITTAVSNLSYLPYSGNPAYAAKPILIIASATTPGTSTVVYTKSVNFLGSCALLPVTFTSFTAKRDESKVVLQWETSSEQNNEGFAIERNINGVWNLLTFIPSQAAGGNSNSRLVYKYEDLNAVKAVSQYRLKQIDIDGQFKYSQIRSVFGEAQAAKVIVYPTPSSNGKVSVVFEETNGTHDISLMDMTGRVIKQWKAVYNNIQIDNLTSGIYHLRIVSRETGIQTVEKVVVSRR